MRRIADALGVPPHAMEAIAELEAERILADPRFAVPHRALSRELLDCHRERMYSERAAEIIEDALREVVIA